MIESDHADIFIAKTDGGEVGVMSVGPPNGSLQFVPKRAAYVGATAVQASARRRGVGTALLAALNTWAIAPATITSRCTWRCRTACRWRPGVDSDSHP